MKVVIGLMRFVELIMQLGEIQRSYPTLLDFSAPSKLTLNKAGN